MSGTGNGRNSFVFAGGVRRRRSVSRPTSAGRDTLRPPLPLLLRPGAAADAAAAAAGAAV